MANNVVGSLIVNLGLETGRLKSDTDKAARHFKSFESRSKSSLNGIGSSVQGLLSTIGGMTGILSALSVAGFGALIKSSINSADEIGKLSTRLGASTEALSQYKHVAELSGVTFETLTMGWQRMTRRVAEAANGFGEAKGALKELNLNAEELNKLAPEDQFEIIADALNGLTSSSDKVRLSMKLFDSGGVSLLQTMDKGSDGIKAMREEADQLGLTLSKDATQGAADANDALTRLTASGKGLGLTLAKELGPTLADIANWLSIEMPSAILSTNRAFREFQIGALGMISELLSYGGTAHQELAESLNGTIGRLIDETISLDNKRREFVSSVQPGGGGDGVSGSINEGQQKALDSLTQSLLTEEERLLDSYLKRKEIVDINLKGVLGKEQLHADLSLQLFSDYESKRTAIEKKGWSERQKFASMSAKDQTKTVLGELTAMTSGIAQTNKKAFQLNKIAATANAVINTYEGVSKSLATYPWPLAGIMAGLHLAAGTAQVSAIQSTSFGATGTTGSISGGGVPSDTAQPSSASTDTTQSSGNQINIFIEGSAIGDENVRKVIVDAIEEAQANDELYIRAAG